LGKRSPRKIDNGISKSVAVSGGLAKNPTGSSGDDGIRNFLSCVDNVIVSHKKGFGK
jgi:hypothetical protein